MPTVTLPKCDVLQVESRSYQKDGETKQARSVLARYAGKIFMFSVAKDADMEKLSQAQIAAKPCGLVLEMSTFGKELDPKFSVLSIEK